MQQFLGVNVFKSLKIISASIISLFGIICLCILPLLNNNLIKNGDKS